MAVAQDPSDRNDPQQSLLLPREAVSFPRLLCRLARASSLTRSPYAQDMIRGGTPCLLHPRQSHP